MLWQFFSLPGIENGIEYRYFSRYRIEVRNSSIVTTLISAISCVTSVQWVMGNVVLGDVQPLVWCRSPCGERVTSGGE